MEFLADYLQNCHDLEFHKMDLFQLKKLAHEYMLKEDWAMEMKLRRIILTKDNDDAYGWYQFAVFLNGINERDLSERCFRIAFQYGCPKDEFEIMM